MKQKIICVVYHDKTTLPILDYIDSQSFTTLALSKSVIIWVYKGLAMLIPPERIANAARIMNSYHECPKDGKIKRALLTFTSDDTIKLPSQIARALVGEDG